MDFPVATKDKSCLINELRCVPGTPWQPSSVRAHCRHHPFLARL